MEPEQTIVTTATELKEVVAGAVQAAVDAAKAPSADAAPPAEEAAVQAKPNIAAVVAEEVKTQVAAQTAAPAITKSETVAVTHLASVSKVNIYSSAALTLIFAAAMVVFAVLFLAERSKIEQQAAGDAEIIRELAQDLVSSQLIKNENIEVAIQRKIDSLKAEGLPEAKAVPMAYIDPEVVKEATDALPDSVLKLPYVKELIAAELNRVSAYAAKELNKKAN